MASTPITRENTRVAIIPETTYGTNPATGAQEIFVDSIDINYDRNKQFITNMVDTSQSYAVDNNQSTTVTFGGKLFKESLAFHALLNRFFKLGTTTGSDPYQHPYTLDYSTVPGSFTLEAIPGGAASSALAHQVTGCVPNRFTFTANQGEVPTFEVECLGREFTRATGPATAYTATTDKEIFVYGDMLTDDIGGSHGYGLKIDTSSSSYYVKPLSFDITLESGLDDSAFTLDSTLRRQIQRGGLYVGSGNLEFLVEDGETWSSHEVLDLIRSNQEFSFRWRYSTGTSGNTNYRHFDLQLGQTGSGIIFESEGADFITTDPGRAVVSVPFQMVGLETNCTLDVHNSQNGTAVNI